MKKNIALTLISVPFILAACKDNTQAQLEQQQKQIEALQQELARQNAQQDNTVYELTASGVQETIPQQYWADGNQGEPVTGNDGQQYIYDSSTGSWLLQSLIGSAAGAFIGNALASKFQRARADTPAVRRAQANYYQSARPPRHTSNNLNTKTVPNKNGAAPAYRSTQRAQPNHRRPARRGFRRR